METNFRIHQNGARLIFVLFPVEGGGPILRKSWSLDSIDLCYNSVPDRRSNKSGEYRVPHRKSLVRGGFNVDVDHAGERIRVVPLTRQGNEIPKYELFYNFSSLGLENDRNQKDQSKSSKTSLSVKMDRLPLKKD